MQIDDEYHLIMDILEEKQKHEDNIKKN